MKDKIRLKEAFEYIHGIFFPRWDRYNQWKVQLVPDLLVQGLYDRKTKTIMLQCLPECDRDLYTLLVHEICHACDPYHGKKWINRMLKVSQKARIIGHKNLEKEILNEMDLYQNATCIRVSAQSVYELIEYTVLARPEWSYKKIVKRVAKQYGCYPEELEKRFRRCKSVYDEVLKLIPL